MTRFNRTAPPAPVVPEGPKEKPTFKRFFKQNLPENHWDRIKTKGETACFVCDKPFKKHQRKIYIGHMLYRHEKCDCFSSTWKKKFRGCQKLINI